MSTATSIIRQDGEGEQMWFAGGGVFTWKATAAETGGAFMLMEDRMTRGKRTPNHPPTGSGCVRWPSDPTRSRSSGRRRSPPSRSKPPRRCPEALAEARQDLASEDVEELGLPLADLLDVEFVEAGVGELLERRDDPLHVGTARHRLGDHRLG